MDAHIVGASVFHREGCLGKSAPIRKLRGIKGKIRYVALLQVNREQINSTKAFIGYIYDFYLAYWEKEHHRERNLKPLDLIPVLGHYHVHKYELYEHRYPNIIAFNTNDRVYFFSADNEMDMCAWWEKLNWAINCVKNKNIPVLKMIDRKDKDDDSGIISNERKQKKRWRLLKKERATVYSSQYALPRSVSETESSVSYEKCLSSVSGYSSAEFNTDDTLSTSLPQLPLSYQSIESINNQKNKSVNFLHNFTFQRKPIQETSEKRIYQNVLNKKTSSCTPPQLEPRSHSDGAQLKISYLLKGSEKERRNTDPPLGALKNKTLSEEYEDIVENKNNPHPSASPFNYYCDGHSACVLTLFGAKINLPRETVASIKGDSTQIKYKSYEITLKKVEE